MAKIVMICGKICSGKSTYANQIRMKNNAVLLSVDEIMLAVFGQDAGSDHDKYTGSIQKFLFDKSIELIELGVNVILDWGFWTKDSRRFAREFYHKHNIECEFHYIDISDEIWKQRLKTRNSVISAGETNAYFVDENLAKKCDLLFEAPNKDEIDIWINF